MKRRSVFLKGSLLYFSSCGWRRGVWFSVKYVGISEHQWPRGGVCRWWFYMNKIRIRNGGGFCSEYPPDPCNLHESLVNSITYCTFMENMFLLFCSSRNRSPSGLTFSKPLERIPRKFAYELLWVPWAVIGTRDPLLSAEARYVWITSRIPLKWKSLESLTAE